MFNKAALMAGGQGSKWWTHLFTVYENTLGLSSDTPSECNFEPQTLRAFGYSFSIDSGFVYLAGAGVSRAGERPMWEACFGVWLEPDDEITLDGVVQNAVAFYFSYENKGEVIMSIVPKGATTALLFPLSTRDAAKLAGLDGQTIPIYLSMIPPPWYSG